MNNQQLAENIENLNHFFEILKFDEKTKNDHLTRVMTLALTSAFEKLDRAVGSEEKFDISEMKSIEDLYKFYEKHLDKATIDKVIKEEAEKYFTGYFETISDQLAK